MNVKKYLWVSYIIYKLQNHKFLSLLMHIPSSAQHILWPQSDWVLEGIDWILQTTWPCDLSPNSGNLWGCKGALSELSQDGKCEPGLSQADRHLITLWKKERENICVSNFSLLLQSTFYLIRCSCSFRYIFGHSEQKSRLFEAFWWTLPKLESPK